MIESIKEKLVAAVLLAGSVYFLYTYMIFTCQTCKGFEYSYERLVDEN